VTTPPARLYPTGPDPRSGESAAVKVTDSRSPDVALVYESKLYEARAEV
jgi:hypothetical protein